MRDSEHFQILNKLNFKNELTLKNRNFLTTGDNYGKNALSEIIVRLEENFYFP